MSKGAFGIGCFVFEASDQSRIDDVVRKYEEYIVDALSSVPPIQDIETSSPRGFLGIYHPKTGGLLLEGNDKLFQPHPVDGHVKFKALIPERIQTRLMNDRKSRTTTDEFSVYIYHTSSFPVAFVICENADMTLCRPSDAVRVIREFLKQELPRHQSDNMPIKFGFLGPSPFWANCYVEPNTNAGSTQGPELQIQWEPQRGYDKATFYYRPPHPNSIDEALTAVFAATRDELGIFYKLVKERHLRWEKLESIDAALGQLIQLHEAQGVRGIIERVRHAEHQARTLSMEVARADTHAVLEGARASRDLSDYYAMDTLQAFRPFVEKELDKTPDSLTTQAREVIQLLESRRTGEIEVVMLLTSSTLGGVIGAALTALLS